MATTNTRRQVRGQPIGGQFATTSRPKPSAGVLDGDEGRPCSSCGQATKRRSGLCRRCDSTSRSNRSTGLERDARAASVEEGDIRACDYRFVPAGAGIHRQCANAVVAPAVYCHRHGGGQETSLCRSVAKARAEAARGECFPVAEVHWAGAKARMESAEGTLMAMLDTDTSRLAEIMVAARAGQKTTVARMSVHNQAIIAAQHYHAARSSGMDDDQALAHAIGQLGQPHLSAKAWERLGRSPTDGAESVVAYWYKRVAARADEADEDGHPADAEADAAAPRTRWLSGVVEEWPLEATEGEPYEVPPDPLDVARPSGHGDPEAAIGTMAGLAGEMGLSVEWVPERPSAGYAFFEPTRSRIVVWDRIAGGDRRAVAHSLAHELGHAYLGHSGGVEGKSRTVREVEAESFAALVCSHHGIDSSELSAWYVEDWRRVEGIDMRAGGLSPLRAAVEAFDGYVAATATPAE